MADDWYSILQISANATADEIALAVDKRSRQAASLANTSPERSQQLREQVRAIKHDLLSGDEARAAYDASRSTPDQAPPLDYVPVQHVPEQQPQQYPPMPVAAPPRNRFLRFMQSGFTCPACSESTLPGDKYCTQCCTQLGPDGSYIPVTSPVTNPNTCPYCGTTAALTHRYCRKCGAGRPTYGG